METNTIARSRLTLQQSARWLPADMDTPISLFMGMAGAGNGILLESAEVDGRWGRYSILACDMALFISCRDGKLALRVESPGLAPLADLEGLPFVPGLRELMRCLHLLPPENVRDLPPITRALYGCLGFGMAGLFNPKLAGIMPPEEADCLLALPGTVLVFDHLYNRLCQVSLGEHRDLRSARQAAGPATGKEPGQSETFAPDQILAEPDEAGYKSRVEQIKEMLRQGEAIQVVPSVRFSTPFAGDPFALYRRMRRFNASPYMFYMRFPELTLFGSSPEVMVCCTEGRLQLSPIAGTRRRGRDDLEDARLAAELRDDPKERAEHVMLVDLGRNDLGRVARPGSVNLERYMEVERFSHVMHLTSRVTARLADGLDALDVLAAAFPAGTVSGAPKTRALEIIRELEGRPRGPYAGCIGWLGLDKASVNLNTGITIRSMWLRDGRLFWQAGGGIVHDSDPELEWKEVCNKSAIMRLALRAEDEEYVSAHR
ncbi:anthranilate synthase component I family protein [Desulfovibrio sp. ZJ200]|uniref:anthranilate synthase component I family protein n=1 Tax=Desulfovibrio sp. ZJ200 TaxID=2709792 RepID=UPI0013EB17D2|nr:anthranilate synthase component I family protein [Desulfovibrio sp. ZJ200]